MKVVHLCVFVCVNDISCVLDLIDSGENRNFGDYGVSGVSGMSTYA